MKKLIPKTLICCVLLGSIQLIQTDSAFAQTSMAPRFLNPITNRLVLPLTNGLGFTNTLVPATNLSDLQLSNVVTLLLSLQTNIEEALPVLATLTSNATFEIPTNTTKVPQTVIPFTTNPAGNLLPPQFGNGSNQIPISMPLGRSIVEIDPVTFQGLLTVRNDLAQALPVLQMLNGTAPSETNSMSQTNALSPTGGTNPFGPPGVPPLMPLTNLFNTPMTNQSHILTAPSPF